jgi:serine/threonine-protein kinase
MAVKVVTPSFAGSSAQVEEFLRSARTLTNLEHPRIVRLHEVGVCPSGFYFVSDYVPGYSAIDILKRNGPLALKRALGWADQMLAALEHAHAQGFVHHGIKPANVLVALVAGKEEVKLADFALARVWQAAPFSGLSVTAAMLELAAFLPPELLFNYQESNPPADQYSVAAVLYHILTAAQPLEIPREPSQCYTSMLRRQCVPIRERRADVPAALADAIHKALARTPNLRFASCAEFRQALTAAV